MLVPLLRQGRGKLADACLDRGSLRLQRADHSLDLRELVLERREPAFAGSGPVIVEAWRHGANLAGREAGGDQVADTLGTLEVGGAVSAIAVGIAPGREQALHFVVPQGAFADAEDFRRLLDSHFCVPFRSED